MSNTREVTGNIGGRPRRLHKSYETSAADTELTVTTPVDKTRVRRLASVLVKYSSAVTKSVVVSYDADHGAGYDTDIQTISLTAAQSGSWLPTGNGFLIAPGDAIKVVAPSHAGGGTSAVTIMTEEQ